VNAKKFDICESLSKNFDIFINFVFRDAGIFFRHQAELVLRHQLLVSNYFVKFFYNVLNGCPLLMRTLANLFLESLGALNPLSSCFWFDQKVGGIPDRVWGLKYCKQIKNGLAKRWMEHGTDTPFSERISEGEG
jgi:hypothetical protein